MTVEALNSVAATPKSSSFKPVGVANPQRTCIGCRAKGSRTDLLRIVADEDGRVLLLDERKTHPGRGAWIHGDDVCFTNATKRRAWSRALRLKNAVSTQMLASQLATYLAAQSRDCEQPGSFAPTDMTESGFNAMSTR